MKRSIWTSVFILLLVWFWQSLPDPIFKEPWSFVLESNEGSLLGAKIAADGQWRFPPIDTVPEKFAKSIVCFEDKRFYKHFGIDLLAIARAISVNLKHRSIKSGASTLSMQVMRLSRKGKPRTFYQKFIEIFLSLRLELSYSKKEILSLYASYAPFGGNVVGIDAAAWRYFGKNASKLSWAESALLAVLPNAPSLIRPGKNQNLLLAKRNDLLKRLFDSNIIDSTSYILALEEPLPGSPHPLPFLAPHLMEWLIKEKSIDSKNSQISRFHSTIDPKLQHNIIRIVDQHVKMLQNQGIYNAGVLVLDIQNNTVVSYIGNSACQFDKNECEVDMIRAQRSTGSIFKPLLYACALESGNILPTSLISDIPTFFPNYRPENFSKTFDGAVPANNALTRSLNIPFVRLLHEYGIEKFHFDLKNLGLSTINKSPSHYGLSLILGGAETTLWDITNTYAGMGRRLGNFYSNDGEYNENDFTSAAIGRPPNSKVNQFTKNTKYLSAGSIWSTFEALKELQRPSENQEGWEYFESSHQIAWKTGTSFGFRDAWSIGVSSKYAVGVWIGNADGEGRPGLVGISAAAPLMFEVFKELPKSRWFDLPYDDMKLINVCATSGFTPSIACPIDSIYTLANSNIGKTCPYHKIIGVTPDKTYRVYSECSSTYKPLMIPWFILPPMEEYFFKSKNPTYKVAPPFLPGCESYNSSSGNNPIELIYPKEKTTIYIPVGISGSYEKSIFKAVHSSSGQSLYWHLDSEFIGETIDVHEIEMAPEPGNHKLTVMDSEGNRKEVTFEILERMN